MERIEWLDKIRAHSQALYDRLAPDYWVKYGLYDNAMHLQFIEKFKGRLSGQCALLDAACGAGRYTGLLLDAGHTVLGIDQSEGMLARARQVFPVERYPGLRFARMSLQEIDFQSEFDGAICIDALEHIPPEDWPGIFVRFHKALKPGGVLYFTVELADWSEVSEAYETAKAQGLPVMLGEVAPELELGEQSDLAVYHYYPTLVMVRAWLKKAGLALEEQGSGDGYEHFVVRGGR